MAKYHSKKTVIDGITFDSKREAQRYSELKLLEKAGEINSLELQKEYTLIPSQKGADGRVIERAVKYRADFVYRLKDGTEVVEDVKGMKTKEYIIKRKLMLYTHGIRIRELR